VRTSGLTLCATDCEPIVDDQSVSRNVIFLFGRNPEPLRAATAAADIATGTLIQLDPDSSDDCRGDNRFFTDLPMDVAALPTCP